MASADHFKIDGCACRGERFGELMGLFGRADGVDFASIDLDDCSGEIESFDGSGEVHRAEEDGFVERKGPGEEEVGGDIGSVAVAEGDGLTVIKFGPGFEPVGEFLGAEGEVFVVELTFGEPSEVAVHAVLLNFSAYTENANARGEVMEEFGELMFVAPGSVEGEDDGLGWIAGGVEEMEVAHVSWGILLR